MGGDICVEGVGVEPCVSTIRKPHLPGKTGPSFDCSACLYVFVQFPWYYIILKTKKHKHCNDVIS